MKKKRAVISIILLISLLLMPMSIMMMSTLKNNPDSIVGKAGHAMHEILGLIFIVAGSIHLVYNWKTLKSYFKKK
jgi:hypothetical protein